MSPAVIPFLQDQHQQLVKSFWGYPQYGLVLPTDLRHMNHLFPSLQESSLQVWNYVTFRILNCNKAIQLKIYQSVRLHDCLIDV